MSHLLLLKHFTYVIILGWAFVRVLVFLGNIWRKRRLVSKPGDYLLALGLLLLLTRTWGFEVFRVTSASMEPTLFPGEMFLAIKRPLWGDPIKQGEVVVVHRETRKPNDIVKRVVGLPGDHVRVESGGVFVNGKPAPWDNRIPQEKMRELWTFEADVSRGHFLLLGDNLANSVDSRFFGPVAEADIVGLAVLRLYPLSRWGWL